ncbi:hypothetical protein AVEN_67219-1 [Araneus ventricosus]|uniref:RNase H type-1 domain-containing protein n=1 Tax=Araneus ventricosus TaxID=182803 RepID=A0A4Y2UQF4_ARAVE|nr:hypothetical protein AVEN_67219-1 [Araneus ventricosus]
MVNKSSFLKFKGIHINHNHTKGANDLLAKDMLNGEVDFASLNDPYTFKSKVIGFPLSFRKYFYDYQPQAGFVIKNHDFNVLTIEFSRFFVALDVQVGNSMSVLKSLEAINDRFQLIRDIKTILQNLNFSFHWVKAHVGTYGNERADFLAKYVWALTDSWQPLFSDPVRHCGCPLFGEIKNNFFPTDFASLGILDLVQNGQSRRGLIEIVKSVFQVSLEC